MVRTLQLQYNFALRPGPLALINTGVHDYLGSKGSINGSSSAQKLNSIDGGDSPMSDAVSLDKCEATILQT